MSVITPWLALDLEREPHRFIVPVSAAARRAVSDGDAVGAQSILDALRRSVFAGPGVVLMTGFGEPDEPVPALEARLRALGRLVGQEAPQSPDGALVGYLEDRPGSDWREEQPMHTDGGDLLALLCVRPAERGGETRLASVRAAVDALAGEPDVLATLHGPWLFDRKGRPGPPLLEKQVLERAGGELHCFHLPGNVRRTRVVHRLGPLPAAQQHAIDRFDAVINSPTHRLERRLEAGELLVLDNRVVLHARAGYEDGAAKRLLLRQWWTVDRAAWRRAPTA